MDKSTAHDDLALVDRILWTADRTLHLPPLILITWGIVAATINGVHQARVLGFSLPLDQLFPLPLINEPLAKLRGLRLGAVPNAAGEHPILPWIADLGGPGARREVEVGCPDVFSTARWDTGG